MKQLYMIRHSKVQIDPTTEPTHWTLSDVGIQAAREMALREDWHHLKMIYHSPEPKAEQTAKIVAETIGATCKVHHDLRELEMRTGFLSASDFQMKVSEYFMGKPDPDFEDFQAAQKRIRKAVASILDETNESVGIVSHGRIITAFYSDLLGRRITSEEWKSIRLPDLSVIEIPTWKIVRGFFSTINE
ncbi:histidine phosphatase family protein [Brevibacillus sp. SYSU BS000544]|uniref:histidine phosphatase family protein n=1 Tax=Brevibacillus sp. SYSU BS000544 TaxID=3416443 RepID=UPI003CE58A7C